MIWAVVVLALGLVAFAIWKRDSVRANFKIWGLNFSLEAKNENPKPQ